MGIGNGRRERGHGPTHGAPISGVGFVDAYLILKPISPPATDERQGTDTVATEEGHWSHGKAMLERHESDAGITEDERGATEKRQRIGSRAK